LAINFKQHLIFLKTRGCWPRIRVGGNRIAQNGDLGSSKAGRMRYHLNWKGLKIKSVKNLADFP